MTGKTGLLLGGSGIFAGFAQPYRLCHRKSGHRNYEKPQKRARDFAHREHNAVDSVSESVYQHVLQRYDGNQSVFEINVADYPDANEYAPYLYAGMLFNVSVKWLDDGCAAPEDEIARTIVDAIYP